MLWSSVRLWLFIYKYSNKVIHMSLILYIQCDVNTSRSEHAQSRHRQTYSVSLKVWWPCKHYPTAKNLNENDLTDVGEVCNRNYVWKKAATITLSENNSTYITNRCTIVIISLTSNHETSCCQDKTSKDATECQYYMQLSTKCTAQP